MSSREIPVNVVGSSSFGRYPKISVEKTVNCFISDNALVPYPGHQLAIPFTKYRNAVEGRGILKSSNYQRIISVHSQYVYLTNIFFDANKEHSYDSSEVLIGTLQTLSGKVWIAENNAKQIAISDGLAIYIYDPTQTPVFKTAQINFVPGALFAANGSFVCAATQDLFYSPPRANTWRISALNNGLSWPDDASSIGLLSLKTDITKAVVPFPSHGNMIIVMGENVTTIWDYTARQLFPYELATHLNFDYGCLQPATVAYMESIVVWLAGNEKSGPTIVYSDGGSIKQITTDGIGYLLGTLTKPQDSQAFLYKHDVHLFYHINFYTDNLSLFYDFNTGKFFHATDHKFNYFEARDVAFFNNQYYFISKNNGNLYALDTSYTTYDGLTIPRIRICRTYREKYPFAVNNLSFPIEQGTTPYDIQNLGSIKLTDNLGDPLITMGDEAFLTDNLGNQLVDNLGNILIAEQTTNEHQRLIAEQSDLAYTTPAVDLSMSYDGGYTFSQRERLTLNSQGNFRSVIEWYQLGYSNEITPQIEFWTKGRIVAFDGSMEVI